MTRTFFPLPLVTVSLLCFALVPADGETWYVGGLAPDFATIQEGIDGASDDDEVIVAQGVYVENINLGGKNLVVRSTLPLSPTVVPNTIIEASLPGPVVTFSGAEGPDCVLSGFTITGGVALEGGGICGGTFTAHNRATIENNIIWGNTAVSSGGIGGGGGGIAFCDGTIQNNVIAWNSAEYLGGGMYDCDGTIQNNTVVANAAGFYGGGLSDCSSTFGPIQNCIVWGNTADFWDPQISGSFAAYSCIQGWGGIADTNISDDPLFVDPSADYRLSQDSPCIDAGNPDPSGLPLTDLDGNPRIMNGVVDMGAFEFQVAVGDIEVSPTECDFGEIELGATAAAAVIIANVGAASLEVSEVYLVGGADFSITSCPELPVVIAPGAQPVEVEIMYAPTTAEASYATLCVVSDNPHESAVEVSLSGTGVAADLTLEHQIDEILEYFAAFVDEGTLTGDGPGKSAKGRLKAFGNMLEAARSLIEDGDFEEAYHKLLNAYRRVDGLPRPPDFVTGEAAEKLASMILDLMDALAAE